MNEELLDQKAQVRAMLKQGYTPNRIAKAILEEGEFPAIRKEAERSDSTGSLFARVVAQVLMD